MTRTTTRVLTWVGLAALLGATADGAPVVRPAHRAGPPAGRPADESLPPGAVRQLGSSRFRLHWGGQVNRVCFSPDKRYLAAATDQMAAVFDAATGRPVACIRDLTLAKPTFAIDGTLLIVGYREDASCPEVARYDPASGRLLGRVGFKGASVNVRSALSPDGLLFATVDEDRVLVFDAQSGARVASFASRDGGPDHYAFSPGGKWFGMVTDWGRFVVFDRVTGGDVCRVEVKGFFVRSFAFAPDGDRVVLASRTGEFEVLDLPAGTVRGRGKAARVEYASNLFIAMTGRGEVLAYEAENQTARVYDVTTGRKVRALDGLGGLNPVVMSPDGTTLAGVMNGGGIGLWDVATGERFPQSSEPSGTISRLDFPSPGQLVGHAEEIGWLAWDLGSGARRRIGPPIQPDTLTAFSRDGKRVVAVDSRWVRVFDAEEGTELQKLPLGLEPSDPSEVWFSPSGREVVVHRSRKFQVHDLTSGAVRNVFYSALETGLGDRPLYISPHGSGGWVAVAGSVRGAGSRSVVRVCNILTGQPVYEIPTAERDPAIAFSRDGAQFVIHGLGGDSTCSTVYDTATGRVIRRGSYAEGLLLLNTPPSPDGRVVVLAGEENSVRVVEVASGKVRMAFRHGRPDPPDLDENHPFPDAVAFSPDGLLLATSGTDVPVFVWDLRRRQAPPGPEPDAAAAERLWRDLAADDAVAAFRAVTTLEKHPAAAVRLFREKVRPAAPVPPGQVARWVGDLDAPDYRTRAAADRALTRVADRAGPALRAAMATTASAEVRERLAGIIDRADRPTPEGLRFARAVEALEYAGTAGARALLREWAAGAPGGRLTDEATAALARLR